MTEVANDGLLFSGYIQPPNVPPDPTGNNWRGQTGPPGPPGPSYTLPIATATVLGGIKTDDVTTMTNGTGVLITIARLG